MKEKYQISSLPRMFEQVAKQIVDYITTEKLEKGTKIPTERNLSDLLEVSRSSVREGLRVLELLRYLDSKQGEGTFVSEPPPFLLPGLVLHQPLDFQQLKNYFEVAILCAETITLQALSRQIPLSMGGDEQSCLTSWSKLNQSIILIGNKLTNPYYLSLWTDIYALLEEHQFFTTHADLIDIETFRTAYSQRDVKIIRELFANVLPQ